MHSSVGPDLPSPGLPLAGAGVLGRVHARRLRDLYRSAGWPSQDGVEVELLACGLIERVCAPGGAETLRLTDAGIAHLARAQHGNRQVMSAHDALVQHIAQLLQRDGRIVWTNLSLRARLSAARPPEGTPENSARPPEGARHDSAQAEGAPMVAEPDPPARWKMCRPDVFSIRNTTVAAYLEPVVHEIKVSRADLLGDLKCADKRDSYLDIGGQCWYVLGCDRKGRPIAQPDEVPLPCGVLQATPDGRLEVLRAAPKRATSDLPFALWMALVKATPLPAPGWSPHDDPALALLGQEERPEQREPPATP